MINPKKYFLHYILNYTTMENSSLNFDLKKLNLTMALDKCPCLKTCKILNL